MGALQDVSQFFVDNEKYTGVMVFVFSHDETKDITAGMVEITRAMGAMQHKGIQMFMDAHVIIKGGDFIADLIRSISDDEGTD
jgi:hypothetical protein